MKVHERTIPLDHLSIREEDRAISISTYLQNIHIHLQSDQGSDGRMFTFPEFYEALQSLLKPQLAPTPSSLPKTPPGATTGENSGTYDLEVGDRVQFNASEGPNLMVTTQGIINCIFGDGVAQIRAEGYGFFLRHVSVLKNLSRP